MGNYYVRETFSGTEESAVNKKAVAHAPRSSNSIGRKTQRKYFIKK